MKIYESAVRKPISTILIFLTVIILGVFSLRSIGIDMYPDMDFPSISVITTYQGANAGDIETNVSKILEDNLNTVSNLKKISSKSQDNLSLLTLEFEWGTNLDEAANDIRDALGMVESLLPDEADKPIILKFNSSMMPILMLSVTADESYAALSKILDEKLINPLNRVDGVGAVSLFGNPTREIQVNVDPRKIEAYGLSIEQISQIIAQENVNVPAGAIDIGNYTFNVKSDLEFHSAEDLRSLVVASSEGKQVLLSDVAQVRDTLRKLTMDSRTNGDMGIMVIVQKQSGGNTVDIVGNIKKAMPAIEKTLPPDIKIAEIMDSSESIVDSINSLSETVMYAFIFVVLVVLFFLGRWRATFIIVFTIPVSLVVAFIYLFATGSTLNIISLSSLSIAIGMVVDDAIVVLENITKHIERGSSPKEASIYGTNEVWIAVIATTLTVVAVFLPLTMVSGMAGIMFKELGWIVSLVVVTSTVAAITLTPMLASIMLRFQAGHTYKGLGVIFRPIDRFLDRLDNLYAKILSWSVSHRALVVGASLAIFVSSLFLLSRVPTEFFPASDNGMIEATIKLDQNLNVDYTSKIARQVDEIIKTKYPEVRLYSARAGAADASGGNAFAAMSESASYMITYYMRLPRASERERDIFEISDLLGKDLDKIPEIVEHTITPGGSRGGGMSSSGSYIDIKIFGYDFNVTNDIAVALQDTLKQVPGLTNITISRDDLRPEYNILFDRDRLALYGLNSSTAAMFVRNRINGQTASKFREDGDEYNIVVRYDEPFRQSLSDVENILIYNNMGHAIRLADVATIDEEFAPPTIERENRQRMVSVQVSMYGLALGDASKIVTGVVDGMEIPDDIYIEMGGSLEDQQEGFSSILMLLALIVILVYVVMATQFESFRMPFIIMFTLPFAFTGVFLALYLTGTPLSMIALIGAVMLVGIVVKNGIVMVDFINLMRERGLALNQAIVTAGKSRLRPVLMTSLTTILGMVPMSLALGEGSETWQPMGIAVVGGLTFSTLLTLIVIPVVYSLTGARRIRKERCKRNYLSYVEQNNRK